MAGPFQCPQLALEDGSSRGRTTRHKKMQTHHAGFLLLCVCVMLIFTDIHLLSVPHAGPLTRTHTMRYIGCAEAVGVKNITAALQNSGCYKGGSAPCRAARLLKGSATAAAVLLLQNPV